MAGVNEELEIVFKNESRKQLQAVLYPDDSNIDESFSLAWLVFNSKALYTSLPLSSSISFVSQGLTLGPFPAAPGSSWLLVKDGETLALTEGMDTLVLCLIYFVNAYNIASFLFLFCPI